MKRIGKARVSWIAIQAAMLVAGGFFGWFILTANHVRPRQLPFVTPGQFLEWFLGGADGFMYALIVFVSVDFISGFMRAIIEKKFSFEAWLKGVFQKILIFILIGVVHIMDVHLIGGGRTLRTSVFFFFISTEGMSLLDNAAAIGLPVPGKLRNILEQLRTKELSENKLDD